MKAQKTPLTPAEKKAIRWMMNMSGCGDRFTLEAIFNECRRNQDSRRTYLRGVQITWNRLQEIIMLQAMQDVARVPCKLIVGDGFDLREAAIVPYSKLYAHLVDEARQSDCCFLPAGRFCEEGRKLLEAYHKACS